MEPKEDAEDRNQEAKAEVEGVEEECENDKFFCCLVRNGHIGVSFVKKTLLCELTPYYVFK